MPAPSRSHRPCLDTWSCGLFRVHAVMALVACLALGVAAPSRATVPSTTSYQGVLTDNAGNLVPDGAYSLTFRIYDVGSGGAALWTETQAGVPVAKGGFAVTLGAVNPITLALGGQHYLGVAVNGGAELVPRVAISPAPQALSLRLPFTANESSFSPLISLTNPSGLALQADPILVVGSETRHGLLDVIGPGPGGSASVELLSEPLGGRLYVNTKLGEPLFGAAPTPYGPTGFGYAYVSGGSGLYGVGISAEGGSALSPSPVITMSGATNNLVLDMTLTGDQAVRLPASAVSAPEIADEPGIAHNRGPGGVNIGTGSTMTDLISVTITTPAPGYVVVQAEGQHGLGADGASENNASLNLSEIPGGGLEFDHWYISGSNAGLPPGNRWHPVSMRRVFFKAAGTYTFYFKALAGNPAGLDNYMWQPSISATYFPTSYGSVVTTASLADAAGEGLTPRPSGDRASAGTQVPAADAVDVDLRELELRAAKLRAAAARAELDVYRARGIVPAELRRGVADAAKPR